MGPGKQLLSQLFSKLNEELCRDLAETISGVTVQKQEMEFRGVIVLTKNFITEQMRKEHVLLSFVFFIVAFSLVGVIGRVHPSRQFIARR